MSEDDFKPIVRNWLGEKGFTVTDIPVAPPARTPDFHLAACGEGYLLELKIKEGDPEEDAEDIQTLERGHVVERSTPITPRNRLSAIIDDGHDQMLAFDPGLATFHVLWIHCEGRHAETLFERFRFTLFGMRHLFSSKREYMVRSYYFRHSAFWRCRKGLDAVLLSENENLQLCVNTVSPRLSAFRRSALFDAHKNALCDPDQLESNEHAFIVDSDVDRNDQDAVLAFLRAKYRVEHLQPLDMGAHTVIAPHRRTEK